MPNEYPVGGVGNVGSLTVQLVPVGIPETVAEPPAATDTESSDPGPQS